MGFGHTAEQLQGSIPLPLSPQSNTTRPGICGKQEQRMLKTEEQVGSPPLRQSRLLLTRAHLLTTGVAQARLRGTGEPQGAH